jgi:uncharacterized protein YjeT (DUF2065 family)
MNDVPRQPHPHLRRAALRERRDLTRRRVRLVGLALMAVGVLLLVMFALRR